MDFIFSWFKQAKIFILGILGAIIAGYVISQNIKRKKAESDLVDLQNNIRKTQIKIIKTEAKVASETKDIELQSHTDTLIQLQENKEVVKKELEEITKTMTDTAATNGKKGIFTFDGLTPVNDTV